MEKKLAKHLIFWFWAQQDDPGSITTINYSQQSSALENYIRTNFLPIVNATGQDVTDLRVEFHKECRCAPR